MNLKGAEDGDLETNIAAHLSTLSAPGDCSLSIDEKITIENKVTEAGRAFGYYNLSIESIDLNSTEKCSSLELSIKSGPQVKITQVDVIVTGEGKDDEVFKSIINKFPIKKGDKLIHSKYKAAKSKFDSAALNRGFFDSKFITSEIKVDVETNSAQIRIEYQTGPRYQFGKLKIPDDERASELITQVLPFKEGDPYLASTLGEFNQSLGQTDYFKQVVARPLLDEAEQYKVPIEVVAVSRPRDIFDVGLGGATDTGPRVTLGWQRPWVNSRGHSMSANIYVSEPKQTATVKYKIPVEDPLNNYVSAQFGVQSIYDNDTNSDTISLALQRHWTGEDNEWNKIAFVRLEQSRFQQAETPQQTTTLLIPGFTLSRHRSRGGLDVNWGDMQQLTIETASDAVISDINLARVTFQTKWLRSFGEHRFLLRAEVGALSTNDFEQVPSDLRYFTGGDQSVRGFAYQSLAPRQIDEDGEEGELLGAKYLNVASLEYSYPVADDWRAAIFTDVGGASNDPLEELAYSIGVGASWMSPVGPIRVYLASGHGDYGNSIRLHLAMGPAL
ncbi:autotransporter assembly complex family protein [Aliiglaciecola sp. 3_MG-2023]|uniref:autotransporter assembly complex protein TamA n=1 Tax=Aliiglaciecola sp. 3_MG-2023 TaxID=3062644 RepID=UPI0026E13D92|nr:autotransporter assembly complex family protein [Aliiglaciecola sp. 3_MG-2023]MDO6692305.1 autotransporter assembly complex family protein [Aliiglaciecola sp. 3_MG-2023]